MDLNYLKKLIKIIDTSGISEIEIEEEGKRIKLSKPRPKVMANLSPVSIPLTAAENILADKSSPKISSEEKIASEKKDSLNKENIVEVKSPMVGTFYRAPAPEADAYVNVGSDVSPGSILCIIEAMKLMNEIEAEVSGKIVKILVENAQPVEYNQPLFLIEKS